MMALTMADFADPPPLVWPASPVEAALQGISINITPLSYTGGVREIRYYLDGAVEPFSTAFLRPYQTFIRTLALPLGAHEVRAVAVDGLGQTGESSYAFELAENKNMPVVNFGTVSDGVLYTSGSVFVVNIGVDDPVGIASVYVYLDNSKADPITSGTTPFVVDTNTLSLGAHHITVVATNLLGVSNDPGDPDSVLEFSVVEPPPGEPPAAPVVTNTPLSENGMTTVEGTTVAGARVDVTNTTLGLTLTVYADGAGRFSVNTQADPKDVLTLVAYDFSQSKEPSLAAMVTVGQVPVLDHIEVQPATVIFTSFAQYQDLIVMGHYEDGSTKNLTSRAVFTSSAMGIAGINAAGRVAPIANGAAIITADVEGKQAAVQVTVNVIILTHISVTPDPVVLIAISETRHLAVTAHYSDDSNRPAGAGLTFVSSDASIATVNSAGVVTAVREGETAVTVYLPGAVPVVVPVVVDTTGDTAPEVEILSPANGAQVERGQSVSITVQGVDTVGGVARFYIELSGAMTYAEQVQVEPPSLSVIKAFPVVIAANAAIGGIITVTVRAEDSGGNLSETLQRMLVVVDGTAPSVSVVEPAPMSGYNYDDTVTVRVSATDAVGVTEIHYFTQGAFEFSGAQNVTPPTTGAEAVFTFRIPYGVASPDVRIQAFAKDAANNEGAAIPVDITITDADITPPQTEAVGTSDPGTSTLATVTYQVTEGLDDLDHVELYFRRDGFGTFNRYTNAAGGNPLGQFVPQSGAMGSIEFDSTRMGGDGQYEFYTVGVDQAGNREAPPTEFIPTEAEGEGEGEGETEGEGEIPGEEVVVADQSVEIHAGTVWVEITVETALGPEATDYDGKNIRVIGVPFVLSGHHSFHNIELIGGATLAHPQTDAELEYELDLDAWTLTIDADSAVDVSGRGYLGGYRPGIDSSGRTLGNTAGSTYRSAGSYGGTGAADGGTPNPLYGNLVQPADLGSGGSGGGYSYAGGDGGGRIQLQTINIMVDGYIASGGENGRGYSAGSGSGGAIFLAISTLSGTGAIRANGGGGEVSGGGGRVAIHYVDMATMDTSLIAALGGQGSRVGGNGTVFLKGVEENSGTLVIDGQGVSSTFSMLSIPPGYIFDNIIIRNEARVVADMPLEVNDTLSILTGSILTHTRGNESGIQIIADHIYVDETSSMDLSAKGYRGGNREGGDSTGLTLGGIAGALYRSGGSYGGYGGVLDGAGSNPPYGSPLEPVYLGSGGSGGVYGYGGGHGGGRADLTARKSLHVDGAIRANGEAGYGYAAGSGSGGSIRITTSLLKGGGVITANGGANEVGGSGGRVAIAYDYVSFSGDDFGGLRNITAHGGHGSN
ncbi:MAG TPA: Ig-like domain-containing protein, partial [Candidatus Hydrogenedentes bacterium]|nr:Ig-like domain-containing protein [Candidatus Hydrogenedentota bacterium]